MLMLWPLMGAIIGAVAAVRRNFSLLGGVLGGFMLGPLAVFLFFYRAGASRQTPRERLIERVVLTVGGVLVALILLSMWLNN